MSVLSDLLRGITPAKRKELDKVAAIQAEKYRQTLLQKQREDDRLRSEKIYTSPIANKIASDLCTLFSESQWTCSHSYWGKDLTLLEHATIEISEENVSVTTVNPDNMRIRTVYSFNYDANGYGKLDDKLLKKEFIQFLAIKVSTILPVNYNTAFYYFYEDNDGFKVGKECSLHKCNAICIRKKEEKEASKPSSELKPW